MTSFLQSPTWQKFQESAGVHTEWNDRHLYLQRKVSFASYWQSSRFTTDHFEIPPFAKSARFLRLEPEDEATLAAIRAVHPVEETLPVQPRQTLQLDIQRPIEDILASFKQKHRYNYTVSQRSFLERDIYSRHTFDAPFERFWALMSQTAERQDFRTHSKEYYQEMLRVLEEDQMVHVLIVRRNEQDLAAMILVTYDGVATYLHGASSSEHRESMAPYYMHVAAMQYAQGLGLKTYDFWGTDAELVGDQWQAKEGAPSYGTTRFKLGFSGTIVQYPGCFDLVLQPFWYSMYKKARRLRGGKRAFH